jgi:hypothetical protein
MMTVAEFLPYRLNIHRHDLRPATLQQYTSLINAHLVPALGSVSLARLQPNHLTAMYAEKRTNGRKQRKRSDDDAPRGLSARTVRHVHVVMHEALDFTVKQQMLARNVADAVDAPRFTRKEMCTWTLAEARPFSRSQTGKRIARSGSSC